jgi:hypothetical protein
LQFLGSLVVLSSCYFTAAVAVNPRGYYDSQLFPQVVLDSRRDKMKLFERYAGAAPVEGLIVGSSRAMKIAPAELDASTGIRFFNFCVDSARSEDYLAIYRWARGRNPGIRVLVVGVDVEALHDDDRPDERLRNNARLWRELYGEGRATMADRVRDQLGLLEKVMSRYYAREMVRSVLARWRPKVSNMSFDADGLLHYGVWEREVDAGTYSLEEHLNGSREEYKRRFMGMSGLSPQRRKRLEQLLAEAARDRVDTVLWLTPIHPDLAGVLRSTTRYGALLEETRSYMAGLSGSYDVAALDFSEPLLFGGTDTDWFDGGHINQKNAALISLRISESLKQHGL